jgi:hypothetical protein
LGGFNPQGFRIFPIGSCSETVDNLNHYAHIADFGNIFQHDLVPGKKRGAQDSQRGVLGAANSYPATEGFTSCDNDLVHKVLLKDYSWQYIENL